MGANIGGAAGARKLVASGVLALLAVFCSRRLRRNRRRCHGRRRGQPAVRATAGRQHGGRDDGDRLGRGRALGIDRPLRPEPRPGRGPASDRARAADVGPLPRAGLSHSGVARGTGRRSISSGTCSPRTSSGRNGSATRSSSAGRETPRGRWSPTRRSTASRQNAPTILRPTSPTLRRPRLERP